MKKRISLSLMGFVLVVMVNAQAPSLAWAKNLGGTTQETVFSNSITVDALGNVYTIGKLKNGTADLDPGSSTFNLTFTVAGGTFISKLDASGNFVWAKQLGDGTATSYPLAIAVDGAGNVYSTGSYLGTGDFDPGVGVFNLTSAGMEDIFISKLDASGNFVWAKKIGTSQSDAGTSIAVDASGAVYTTGWYTGFAAPVDFDPGAGTFNLPPNGCPTCAHLGAYVLKLDTNGNFVWADQLAAGIGDATGNQITIDAAGNVYTTGVFTWLSADFDPGIGIFTLGDATTDQKTFISKLDASGNFVWAKGFYAQVSFTNPHPNGIEVDGSGNVITAGYFTGTVDFDPGAGVFNLSPPDGFRDAYISKLDAAGNFVWAIRFGSASSDDEVNSIAIDATGDVYAIGEYSGAVDFDPGAGVFNLTSQTSSIDTYISKLDVSGNFVWAYDVAKTIDSFGANQHSIAADNSGNLYATGLYLGTTDFDPSAGIFNMTPTSSDLFVIKLGTPTAPLLAISTQPVLSTGCNGYVATFTTLATGTTNIIYQWQFSSTLAGTYNDFANGGGYSNVASATLSVNTTGNFGAGFYRCKINGDLAATVFTNAAQLTLLTSGCATAPVIATVPLATQINGKITLNLLPLITTTGILDVNSIKIITQPSSGALATIVNGVLTIDYAGKTFLGTESIKIEACNTNGACAQQVFNIDVSDTPPSNEIIVYNAVSPEGKNPILHIGSIEGLPSKVSIYNRWGDEVFSISDYDNKTRAFAGLTNGGNKLTSGTYFYKIILPSAGKTLTGFLSLKY
jgi:CHU_C Type IX secretion signal domain/Beta-propeller repeat